MSPVSGGKAQTRSGTLALLAGAWLLAAAALAAPTAHAVGPYPSLGSCQVFPDPPASLSPRAPSLPNQAAWNQDISKAPRDPRSAAYIAYVNGQGGDHLHPDFGSPRPYGFPFAVVGPGQRQLPVNYTAYGEESDPGPFPVPGGAPVEGGNRSDGDRHVLAVDRSACRLYELYRAFFVAKPRPHWNADSGVAWDLRSTALRPDSWTSADAAGLPIFAAWSATTKSTKAASSTRSGSPSRAPATPGSTPPPTAPATPPAPAPRRWGCGCGSRRATGSAASAATRGRSRWR